MPRPKGNTIVKALRALEALSTERDLQLHDIARTMDVPDGTAHRIMTTLMEEGYVRQPKPGGPYMLGWKIATMASALTQESRFIALVSPMLSELARELGQAINLGVIAGSEVMILKCALPPNSSAVYTAPNSTLPLHATALGKAMLAYLSPEEAEAILSEAKPVSYTPQTITKIPDLLAELNETRRRGYALDRGEVSLDFHCAGAAIRDEDRRPIAAISTSVIWTSSASEARMEEFGILLSATAQRITKQIWPDQNPQ